MSADCIFCKIVAGEIPCIKIYEDEHVLAFMDIGPIIEGHALVIPKEHFDPITDTPDHILQHLITIVKNMVAAQKTGLSADGCNVIQNNGEVSGQAVPHLHFHVIPRFEDDGHHWNWTPKEYETLDQASALAKRMAEAMQK